MCLQPKIRVPDLSQTISPCFISFQSCDEMLIVSSQNLTLHTYLTFIDVTFETNTRHIVK